MSAKLLAALLLLIVIVVAVNAVLVTQDQRAAVKAGLKVVSGGNRS